MPQIQPDLTTLNCLALARQASARLGHGYVGTEHLLLALAGQEGSLAQRILTGAGLDAGSLESAAAGLVGVGDPGCPPCQGLTPNCRAAIELAAEEALGRKCGQVGTEHLLLGLLRVRDSTGCRMIAAQGVHPGRLHQNALASLGEGNSPLPFRSRPKENELLRESRLLEQYARDLTKLAGAGELDPVTGRDRELERVIEILCRRTKNNPVLLGDPGVGKTALAEALAQAIAGGNVPDSLKNARLLSLDLPSVVAGTKYRGEFEDRLRKILKELKRIGGVILFLDEIHTLVGAGSAEGAIDAANILKPALGRGELQVIGATTQEEWRRHICKDAALERRFQPVRLEQPDREGAVAILRTLRPRYERHHHVLLPEETLDAAVTLSLRYLPDRFLPDKAIDLMDEAAARVRIRGKAEPEELRTLRQRRQETEQALSRAIEARDFEQCAQLRDAQESFARQWEEAHRVWTQSEAGGTPLTVEPRDVAEVLSLWTGIPTQTLSCDEAQRLLALEAVLKQRIVGQDEGVSALARSIRRSRSGLQESRRPVGVFLFAGPSGVGKTELSRTLAQALFGTADALLRLDMSEFSEGHSIARLIGSPPGYVGHEEGGQLTEGIRRRPYSVVLFDELEKANDQVWNLLLQLMEDGSLTDSQGRKADFRNAVVILTSNLGAHACTGGNPLGFGHTGTRDYAQSVQSTLRQTFRPEFLNRLDEIICFTPLEEDAVAEIARRMLEGLGERLAGLGVRLAFDDALCRHCARNGHTPQYGVRPLRRYLRRHIEDPAADLLLRGALQPGCTLRVSPAEEGLALEVQQAQ